MAYGNQCSGRCYPHDGQDTTHASSCPQVSTPVQKDGQSVLQSRSRSKGTAPAPPVENLTKWSTIDLNELFFTEIKYLTYFNDLNLLYNIFGPSGKNPIHFYAYQQNLKYNKL